MRTLKIRKSMLLLLSACLVTCYSTSRAFSDNTGTKDTTAKVDSVINIEGKSSAGLNEWVIVYVSQLEKLLQTTESKSLLLYINGMPLVDCRSLIVDINRKELRFFLKRTDSTRATWNTILGRPNALTRFVTISVGVRNGPPVPSRENAFTLIVIRKWQFWVFVPFFIAFQLVIYLLYKKTNLLRDTPTANVPEGYKRTYSLARSQVLFWTVLVLVSFVFIWVATGDINTITDSVLILIGISSATALGARAIDATNASKNSEGEKNDVAKGAEATKLETTSGSYWKDLLGGNSDDGVHRLQIVVWTIVLGIIFICSVWADLTMPEFNNTLLTLMGISSGTYIGFKMKE
ncbi:hypothetical protein C0389_10390 [bacterium]|nr:hypothetical protein [bacterium]